MCVALPAPVPWGASRVAQQHGAGPAHKENVAGQTPSRGSPCPGPFNVVPVQVLLLERGPC